MALDVIQRGATSGNGSEVDASGNQKVILPADGGGIRVFSEIDPGNVIGTPSLASPEVDDDFRVRVSNDLLLDEENFCYTAQNTGKHTYANTTMTNAWAVGGMSTNSGNITTTTTGTTFGAYAYFPIFGTDTLSFDIEGSFSSQPTTNTVIDFGAFLRGAANPYAPTDGAYFRLTSAGLQGVVNYNGTETTTAVFPVSSTDSTPWTYVNNKKYQFILYIGPRDISFWINDNGNINLMGTLATPIGNGQPCASSSLPFSVRHAIVGGAASGVQNFQLARYNVRCGGSIISTTASTQGNRLFGSYQGLGGGTMGSLANFANSANPTAAVPTNTTAALGTGLGGQFWETDTLAVTTDGVICSYQVPAGTASLPGRRLVIRGIKIQSFVQTALTGGGYNAVWSLAFGHTAVSLATAEAAATKAPRRIPLGVQSVASAAAALTMLQDILLDLGDAPVFVNPGEFVAVAKKKVGTAPSAGVIAHNITFVYGWE